MPGIYSIDDLRNAAKSAGVEGSDAFLIQDYAKRTGDDPAHIADFLGYDPDQGGVTGQRFHGAYTGEKAGLQRLGSVALGKMGFDGASKSLASNADDNEMRAQIADQRARAQGGVQDFKDVHGPSDFGSYLAGQAIGMAPMVAEQGAFALGDMATGGALTPAWAARLGAMAPRVLGGAGLEAGASLAARRAALESGAGKGMITNTVPFVPSMVGQNLQAQAGQIAKNGGNVDDSSSYDLLSAGIGGTINAASNIVNPIARLTHGDLSGFSPTAMADGVAGRFSGPAARMALNGGEGAAHMGGLMGFQNAVTQMTGNAAVDPNYTFNTEEMGNAVIGGASLGGMMGAGLGGWRRKVPLEAKVDAGGAVDLLAQKTAAPKDGFLTSYGQDAGPLYSAPNPVEPESPHGPMPGQTDLFHPNGEPTYGAEQAKDRSAAQLPMVADSAGVVAKGYDDAQALQDPGTQQARQQFLQRQEQQQEQQRQVQIAQTQAQRILELKQRTEKIGLDPKNSGQVQMWAALEQARDQKLITPEDASALAGTIQAGNTVGQVRSQIEALKQTHELVRSGQLPSDAIPAVLGAIHDPAHDAPYVLKQLKKEAQDAQREQQKQRSKVESEQQKASDAKTQTVAPDTRPEAASEKPTPDTPATPAPGEAVPVQPTADTSGAKPVADNAGAVPTLTIGTTRGKGAAEVKTGTFGGKTFTAKTLDWNRLLTVLNLDSKGNQLGAPRSYEEAAANLGLTAKNRRSTIAKSLEKFGLNEAAITRLSSTELAANDGMRESKLGEQVAAHIDSTPEGENPGMRVESTMARAAGGSPIVSQDNYKSVVGDRANPQQLTPKAARVTADTTLKNDAKVAPKVQEAYDPAKDPARAANEARVESVSKGRMDMMRERFADLYAEHAEDYDSTKSDKAPKFAELSNNAQERFVLGVMELSQEGKLDATTKSELQRGIERTEEAKPTVSKGDGVPTGLEKDEGAGRPKGGQLESNPTGRSEATGVAAPDARSRSVGVSPSSLEHPSEAVTQQLAQTFIHQFGENAPPIKVMRNGVGVIPGAEIGDKGVLHNGTVYIFSDGHATKADVAETLWHETFHFGLRKLLSKEQFIDQMRNLYQRDSAIRARADAWASSPEGKEAAKFGGDVFAKARGVDEALADLAHSAEAQTPQFQKTINTVMDWMAKLADKLGLSTVASSIRAKTGTEARDYIRNVLNQTRGGISEDRPQWSATAFSKEVTDSANSAFKTVKEQSDRIRAQMPTKAREASANISDATTRLGLIARTDNQLANDFAAAVPTVKEYVGLKHNMSVMTEKLLGASEAIGQSLRKLAPKIQDQLNSVMHDATMWRINPEKDGDNAHLTPAERAKVSGLQARFNALTPEAQRLYATAKESLSSDRTRLLNAYNQIADYAYSKLLADTKDPAAKAELLTEKSDLQKLYSKNIGEVKGPYFPLLRFGEYLAIGESKEFQGLQKQLGDASGKDAQALQGKLDAMKAEPQHYQVSARNSRGERDTAVSAMAAQGLETRKAMTDQHVDGLRTSSRDMLTKIMHVVDVGFDKDIANELNKSLTAMMMRDLPEMHALRREAMRVGVQGADKDMIRSFATASTTNAHYVSRMLAAPEMADSMLRMKDQVKGNPDHELLHREMEKRVALDMQRSNTPVQDFLGKASWMWHFAASPSFMVVHAAQPWVMSLPVIGGRFGMAKAFSHMVGAHADALKIMAAAKFDGNKVLLDIRSGINERTVPDAAERAALHELLSRQVIGGSMQSDLQQIAQGGDARVGKAMKWMGIHAQETESMSRMATALAAFRSAREGMGLVKPATDGNHLKSVMAAVDYAHRVTIDTQADATSGGTSRLMRNGGPIPMAKLVMQFRNFQQKAIYTLATHLKNAELGGLFKEEKASDEAKIARATLGYLAMTSGLSAGALGLPAADAGLWAANKFMDEDDPRGPAEARLQNFLTHMFGQHAATALSKGIPAAFGADMHSRIGTGDVLSPFKFLNTAGMRTGQEKAGATALAILGPVGGMAAQAYDAAQRFNEGDFARGAERMAPKVVADMLKARRYATEGITDGKGLKTGTDLSAADIAMRGFGISPTKEADYYEGTHTLKGIEGAVKQREAVIARHYVQALDGSADMGPIREAIAKFNEQHPESPINGKKEMAWRKAYRDDTKNRTSESGVRLATKKQSVYNAAVDYAN